MKYSNIISDIKRNFILIQLAEHPLQGEDFIFVAIKVNFQLTYVKCLTKSLKVCLFGIGAP